MEEFDKVHRQHASPSKQASTTGSLTMGADSESEGDSHQLEPTSLLQNCDYPNRQDVADTKGSVESRVEPRGVRTRSPASSSALWQICLDLVFTLPALAFLVYGAMVRANDGKNIEEDPVPTLQTAAKYGPTIFPIVFAAVAANFLKAVAAWKVERGITVLNLHALMRSRSVFSAFMSILETGAIFSIIPLTVLLWALSPLGGQAALRVVETAPSTDSQLWNYEYLEFSDFFPYPGGVQSSAAESVLPSVCGTFASLLSSPESTKNASQDIFGNIKIPLLEHYTQSNMSPDSEGWYTIKNDTGIPYSALAGMPLLASDGKGFHDNTSFTMKTSYMYANCSMAYPDAMSDDAWLNYTQGQSKNRWGMRFTNARNLVIDAIMNHQFTGKMDQLVFTSVYNSTYLVPGDDLYEKLVVNATCGLTTTFVEVDVDCHVNNCQTTRIRSLNERRNETLSTVLNGRVKGVDTNMVPMTAFFSSFVNSTDNGWSASSWYKMISTPLERYFTAPGTPYTNSGSGSEDAPDYTTLGDALFSQRFSVLLNTWWLSNIAPSAITGNINFTAVTDIGSSNQGDQGTGTLTPDELVLRVNKAWLTVLFISSLVILCAAAAAVGLGALRRGPDILEHDISLMRDNRYLAINDGSATSMEDGSDQLKRLKKVKVCLGDVKPEAERGYIALATLNDAVPLSKQRGSRMYE